MNVWVEQLADLLASGERVSAVTVAGVRGSAPREVGARMLVTESEIIGTIGGGQLEHQCTRLAVEALRQRLPLRLERFPLGASMGQCCGGIVEVMFETFDDGVPGWLRALVALKGQRTPAMLVRSVTDPLRSPLLVTADAVFDDVSGERIKERTGIDFLAPARERLQCGTAGMQSGALFLPVIGSDFDIALFGAGHVGSALIALLTSIDCNVRWIDSRPGFLRQRPNNVCAVESPEPALEVAAIPAGGFCLIMTHSHAVDFDVCRRALARDDLRYVGLIGSRSKRRRFEKRLSAEGLSAAQLAGLTCPIGVGGIQGKKPAEIAVAVTAELLRVYEASACADAALPAGVSRLKRLT
ncbi:MAG: xanthine dehydrogenase accessory protein XdhC [Pseudomonadota bacterium]